MMMMMMMMMTMMIMGSTHACMSNRTRNDGRQRVFISASNLHHQAETDITYMLLLTYSTLLV